MSRYQSLLAKAELRTDCCTPDVCIAVGTSAVKLAYCAQRQQRSDHGCGSGTDLHDEVRIRDQAFAASLEWDGEVAVAARASTNTGKVMAGNAQDLARDAHHVLCRTESTNDVAMLTSIE